MIDDATWIAARKAYSLAHREMYREFMATRSSVLPEPLRSLRNAHDYAETYLKQVQRDRLKAGQRA